MATQLQIRRGTSTQVAAFTGAEGEIVVNTTNDSVHVNDGSTAGGFEMARADLNNVSDTDLNAALTGNTVSALTVTTLTAGTVTADGGTIVSTGSDAFSSKAVGGYAIQAYQDATSSGHTALDLRSDATTDTRYLIRGYNDAAGTPTEVFSVGADGTVTASEMTVSDTDDIRLRFLNATTFKAGLQVVTSTGDMIAGSAVDDLAIRSQANMLFSTGGNTERMRIDASGNLLVGKTSANFNSSGRGNVEIGGTGSAILALTAGSSSAYIYNSGSELDILAPTGHAMRFFTNGSNERMRIDSSGNLLVGTSVAHLTSSTFSGYTQFAGGHSIQKRSGGIVAYYDRLTDDGIIMQFRRQGSTVGSITANSGSGGFLGIKAGGSNELLLPLNSTPPRIQPSVDDSFDIGTASARFDNIYATNGTIQTSDRNEKQDIEALSEAEQRVAVAAKGLLRKFRWKSSVEKKGDDARIHFGIIAQDLQAAFESEGLDAGRYAMFISSTWTDEETGEERSRLGVRYSELLAFIISAV